MMNRILSLYLFNRLSLLVHSVNMDDFVINRDIDEERNKDKYS